MSHRTNALPPLTGLPRVLREMRYHEASRQILGVLISVWFALIAQPLPWLLYSATPVVVLGIGVRLWASGVITKNRRLATSGPYVYVRHPLYVGNILILAAFVLASGVWWTALVAAAFLLFYYPPAIEYEERKLRSIFGEEWDRYAEGTRPLLPSFGNRPAGSEDTWSFKKSLTVNWEPVIAAFLLAWFISIYTKL